MTLESFRNRINEAKTMLDTNRVADAFNLLNKLVVEEGNHRIAEKLGKLRETYGYMIHYFIEGSEDSTRSEVYSDTVDSLRTVCDDLLLDKLGSDSTGVYFSTSRIIRHRNLNFRQLWEQYIETVAEIELSESVQQDSATLHLKKDDLMRRLFEIAWTSRGDKKLNEFIVDKICSGKSDTSLSLYLISALVLSLLSYYDRDKIISLLDIYDRAEDEAIAARALIGIVFAIRKYKSRISGDKKITTRLALWQDSLITYSRLRDVIKEIIRTRDTDRVAAKMRDEVIPELMKLRPEMLKKMRDASFDFESNMLENNPEWEEMLEKNGLADKMRELTEMQSEGADLMMVTFSGLKGFPFFQTVSSWFLPFDIDNPAIHIDESGKKTMNTILDMGASMCDSDKYSLIFAFSSMPEQQRSIMFNQLEQQYSQMMEERADLLHNVSHPEFNTAAVIFIRELYRFFRLFSRKSEFEDPFLEPFNFIDLPIIGEMLAEEDIITVLGEFYFKRGFYQEALELFKTIESSKGDDHIYWEKVGYSYQSLKDYGRALQAYTKSELLSDPGLWLLKQLALINKRLGNFNAASEYYSRALSADPDNVSLIMNAGNAHHESGELDLALGDYYHANYLDPDNIKIWRAIAWTELESGNFDKALIYYGKIIAGEADAIDYLNAGHVYLASNDIKNAVSLYRKSAESGLKDFEESFRSDFDILKKLGVDSLTQNLVIDAVKIGSLS